MSVRRYSLCFSALILFVHAAAAQQTQNAAAVSGAKQMTPADLRAWRSIRTPVLSTDGKWFAYVLAPNEGDATVVVRQTADGATEQRFSIGELPAGAANLFGGTGAACGWDPVWTSIQARAR